MKIRRLTYVLLAIMAIVSLTYGVHAQIGVVPPSPDRLRFRVITDEPIAAPDVRSVMIGWRAVIIKDTLTQQCFVTFITPTTISRTDLATCP